MRLVYLQHVDAEDLANIEPWATAKGFAIRGVPMHRGGVLPDVQDLDWLVVMGGPMNIHEHDAHPWLVSEKAFIRACIEVGKTVVGVCLGGQLIADVLGGPVTRNEYKEIGWWPVNLTDEGAALPLFEGFPKEFVAFHWHGDTFATPPGAVRVIESEGCANQAYLYGDRVLGLQFHLEESTAAVDQLLKHFEHEMTPGRYVQSPEQVREGQLYIPAMNKLLYKMLDGLFASNR
ncbi:MAG: aminotransferase [Candidatus Hydrogenedentota bacterium]